MKGVGTECAISAYVFEEVGVGRGRAEASLVAGEAQW